MARPTAAANALSRLGSYHDSSKVSYPVGVVPSAYLTVDPQAAYDTFQSSTSRLIEVVLCLCVRTVSSVPGTGSTGCTFMASKVAAPAIIIFLLTEPQTATFKQ